MEQHHGRIRLLDILRGFAILGTLGTNIWLFAHAGNLNYITTFDQSGWWEGNDLLRMFVLFLINGKLLGLLTIMFGVGLEMKYRQAKRKGAPWPGVYLWAVLFLVLEGLLHFIFVLEYDILMSYGLTAIIVAFIIKGGERLIARMMIVIGSAIAFLMLSLAGLLLSSGSHVSLGSFSDIAALYQDGTWVEQVKYRLANIVPLRLEAILVIPSNVFLFLLGVRFIRAGVFSPDENGRQLRKRLFKLGVYVGAPLNLLIFVPGGAFDLPVRYLFAPLMSLGYIAIIARMIQCTRWEWLWRGLENVGKMSLSCYVLQNVIASIIFYGWGLGLAGQLNSAAIIAVWLMISIIQIGTASLWLDRFKLGPMETVRKTSIGFFESR
ncbi:DUF418 domain-containing protein [Paenibacillus sp. JCM 10914]|uniref:DUF418 domain-containing protein n=1 Tax=Paenibacillus sp. JCM 10914 TaxID=1236974 RepID=UPI0003CC5307|nr:DUF418 domain-containing protein [Paenibacillus sp. JCM 10914]GAE06424.1 hypothetical protein JCM10914_2584 [Paenibacillus sp. JCM 10914]